ncbi:hypothetical protein CK203_049080 [Vitis vinifera]|uniref:Uncharacterized protein n=1 Tax=Vitis vinifera TaxID=29760 RepID=A0A438HC39_VITVI|nr:hypothetical protein CK203_049080 [Vitis vinifera]
MLSNDNGSGGDPPVLMRNGASTRGFHFIIILECRVKSRITLSIKQLEEDPLLETLDKVIPQDGSTGPDSLRTSDSYDIEPLPGLETIFEELLQEEGYDLIIA